MVKARQSAVVAVLRWIAQFRTWLRLEEIKGRSHWVRECFRHKGPRDDCGSFKSLHLDGYGVLRLMVGKVAE